MRILITNDDGIEAPGLDVLEKIATGLTDDVWVVAPETDNSGASHSLTLAEPLRMREIGKRRYAVKGTPTDCVIMGVRFLLKNKPPDLVLSWAIDAIGLRTANKNRPILLGACS
jgi:5'-nucleotidase